MRRIPVYLALVLACQSADATISVRHSKPYQAATSVKTERVWRDVVLDSISLAAAGLRSPDRMVLTSRGPVVQDGVFTLIGLDWKGQIRWTTDTRQRGLGRITDIKQGRADSVVAVDGENGAVLVVGADGKSRSVNLESATFVNLLIPLGSGYVAVTADSARPLATFAANGKLVTASGFPWPPYSSIAALARQGYGAVGDGNTWVFGFNMGDGFFVFDSLRARPFTGHYVEPIAFPDVIVRPHRGGASEELSRFLPSALSLSLMGRELAVLFGGTDTTVKAKVIDVFSATSGRYMHSMRLPQKARGIAARGDALYVLTPKTILVLKNPTQRSE
jgi:hypothetical protein